MKKSNNYRRQQRPQRMKLLHQNGSEREIRRTATVDFWLRYREKEQGESKIPNRMLNI